MDKKEKVSFIHSISLKISLLTIIIVIMSVVACTVYAGIRSKSVVSNVYGEYILNLAEASA